MVYYYISPVIHELMALISVHETKLANSKSITSEPDGRFVVLSSCNYHGDALKLEYL